MNIDLKQTIKEDCKYYEQIKDGGFYTYMYLNECSDSNENGLYQLILNGRELWYGTLQEINAIVKTMVTLIEKADEYA